MTFVDEVLAEAEYTPSPLLSSVPDNEITESLCRLIFYPHIDDDTWEDFMEMVDLGGEVVSERYGRTVYRDQDGGYHFILGDCNA